MFIKKLPFTPHLSSYHGLKQHLYTLTELSKSGTSLMMVFVENSSLTGSPWRSKYTTEAFEVDFEALLIRIQCSENNSSVFFIKTVYH